MGLGMPLFLFAFSVFSSGAARLTLEVWYCPALGEYQQGSPCRQQYNGRGTCKWVAPPSNTRGSTHHSSHTGVATSHLPPQLLYIPGSHPASFWQFYPSQVVLGAPLYGAGWKSLHKALTLNQHLGSWCVPILHKDIQICCYMNFGIIIYFLKYFLK